MGSTFVVFDSLTVCFCLIIMVFGLLCLLGSAYCGVPSCTTAWENKCWDEPRQQCNTVQVPNKVTTYEQKCTTEYEQKCNTVYDTEVEYKPREECRTVQVPRTESVPEEKCEQVPEEKCETKYEENVPLSMNRSVTPDIPRSARLCMMKSAKLNMKRFVRRLLKLRLIM